ncbi:MAG: hypothetical protein ACYCWE_03380 [Eubacteriales bacterium]
MRKTCILLVLVLAMSFIISCSGKDSGSDTILPGQTTAAADSETIEQRPVLPDKDYEGYEFIILCSVRHPSIIPNYFDIDSEDGDILNDIIYKRNLAVEEKYNIKITADTTGVNAGSVRSAILAGGEQYDMLLGGISVMGTLAFDNLLLDLNEIDLFNLDMPWWDTELNDGLTIANRLFFGSGSLITTNSDATYIVRFNIDLGIKYNVAKQDLYDMVRDGKWTIDKMIETARPFSADLNGDGSRTWEDQYGIACVDSFFQALFYGAGLSVTAKDSDDIVKLEEFDDHTDSALSKIMEVFTEQYLTLNGNVIRQPEFDHAATADNAIADSRAFFHGTLIEAMTRSRNVETAIGILPIPKYEESQVSYTSMINPNGVALLLGISATSEDIERTAIITEALMAESYYTVKPAYYNTVLQHKLLRDEESFEMLDYILINRISPDLGYVYAYGNLLANLMKTVVTGTGNFASVYESAKLPAQKQIDEHILLINNLK